MRQFSGVVGCSRRYYAQIMYAAIFTCCFQDIGLMKIFAWEMIHRPSITREIKWLELRIAELNETVKDK